MSFHFVSTGHIRTVQPLKQPKADRQSPSAGYGWIQLGSCNYSTQPFHSFARLKILCWLLYLNFFYRLTGAKGGNYLQCTKLLLPLWEHGFDSWGWWLQEPHLHSGLPSKPMSFLLTKLVLKEKKTN